MPKDKLICGIDVGSSKVATLIATPTQEGQTNLIGVSSVPSRGVKKGQIVDIEAAVDAITESLEAAERMAGISVSSAMISIGGPQIESVNQHAVVAVAHHEGEIIQEDVARVNDAARAIPLPSSREILHVIPRSFTVDGQGGIADPIGMTGVRLETDTHIITGATTAIRNLTKCVGLVGVQAEELIFSGVAASQAVLTETEKELGVILVDIGGETTDVVVFVDGAIAYSAVIPLGGRHVTSDIAVGLRISLEAAEKVKLLVGQKPKPVAVPESRHDHHSLTANINRKKEEDILDLKAIGVSDDDSHRISRKAVADGIIRPRLQEIYRYVGKEIKKSGFGTQTPSGLVLTGGGALTVGALEQAKYVLGFPARMGRSEGFVGLVDEIDSPVFATAAGLIIYGARSAVPTNEYNIPGLGKGIQLKGLGQKFTEFLRSFLP